MTAPSEVDVVVGSADADTGSYVDWPAIIAGIVLASGISLVLLTFGSAIGLSMTNFRLGGGIAPIWIAIVAGLWLLLVQISSFMAGGYITGRLRKRHDDATEDEVDVRDGAHGLLVWGGALVVGALIAVSGLGAAATAIGSAASTLTTAAANVAGETADSAADPSAYFVDMLFRRAPAATPAAPTEAAPDTTAVRGEAARIFVASAVSGEISADDRTYLAQLVATNSGLSDEEAQARVDQVITAIDNARTEAAEVAETARKTGVLAAFLTAAVLLVSAVGAFWAAQKGGQHRDQGTVFANVFRRF